MGGPANNLEIARSYLQALERGEPPFFAPDVVLEEFPNLLTPLGKRRDLAAALQGAELGKKIMSLQIYKIKQELADLDRVGWRLNGPELWLSGLVPFRLEGK